MLFYHINFVSCFCGFLSFCDVLFANLEAQISIFSILYLEN